MKTLELVKSRIEVLDRNINSLKEIDANSPVMKRQRVNEKMEWILQNPDTLKWAVVTAEDVDDLNDLFNVKKTGRSIPNDQFMFHA